MAAPRPHGTSTPSAHGASEAEPTPRSSRQDALLLPPPLTVLPLRGFLGHGLSPPSVAGALLGAHRQWDAGPWWEPHRRLCEQNQVSSVRTPRTSADTGWHLPRAHPRVFRQTDGPPRPQAVVPRSPAPAGGTQSLALPRSSAPGVQGPPSGHADPEALLPPNEHARFALLL